MWNVSSIVLRESTPPIPTASVNVEDFIVEIASREKEKGAFVLTFVLIENDKAFFQ